MKRSDLPKELQNALHTHFTPGTEEERLLKELMPEWLTDWTRMDTEGRMRELLELARSGAKKPRGNSPGGRGVRRSELNISSERRAERRLGNALQRYVGDYPDFALEIRQAAPLWFRDLALEAMFVKLETFYKTKRIIPRQSKKKERALHNFENSLTKKGPEMVARKVALRVKYGVKTKDELHEELVLELEEFFKTHKRMPRDTPDERRLLTLAYDANQRSLRAKHGIKTRNEKAEAEAEEKWADLEAFYKLHERGPNYGVVQERKLATFENNTRTRERERYEALRTKYGFVSVEARLEAGWLELEAFYKLHRSLPQQQGQRVLGVQGEQGESYLAGFYSQREVSDPKRAKALRDKYGVKTRDEQTECRWQDLEQWYIKEGRIPDPRVEEPIERSLAGFENSNRGDRLQALRSKYDIGRRINPKTEAKWAALEECYRSTVESERYKANQKLPSDMRAFYEGRVRDEPQRIAQLRAKYGVRTQEEQTEFRWQELKRWFTEKRGLPNPQSPDPYEKSLAGFENSNRGDRLDSLRLECGVKRRSKWESVDSL